MKAHEFIDALIGNANHQPIQVELSSISKENAQIAKSLITLARKLESEGKKREADELRLTIRSLLDNNQRLLETTNQTLRFSI